MAEQEARWRIIQEEPTECGAVFYQILRPDGSLAQRVLADRVIHYLAVMVEKMERLSAANERLGSEADGLEKVIAWLDERLGSLVVRRGRVAVVDAEAVMKLQTHVDELQACRAFIAGLKQPPETAVPEACGLEPEADRGAAEESD